MSFVIQVCFVIFLGGISLFSAIASHWNQAIFFLMLSGFLGLAMLIVRKRGTYIMNECTVFLPSEDNKRDDNA